MTILKEVAGLLKHNNDNATLRVPNHSREYDRNLTGLIWGRNQLDRIFFGWLQRWSIQGLRVGLGIVFLWFGGLKLLGYSPVIVLVQQAYPLLPFEPFFVFLGIWEVIIGLGLIFNRALRCILVMLWFHMAGTLLASVQIPSLFFLKGNPFLLTMEGEFLAKNIVLIAASLVIGGYEIRTSGENAKPLC
jgi:uncharacterized membrane protein YkgB